MAKASIPILCLCALLTPVALADTVWTITTGANAKPFERKNMKVEGMTAEGLLFRSATVNRAAEPRPLKEIYRIQVDEEKALNDAETAFVASKWDDAVAGYQRAIGASRKDWVKHYAALRLIAAAEKSGKFSAGAAAYAALVARDLKAAEAAKPEIPKDAKRELPAAISSVKTALADPKLKAAQKTALQAFLAELYIANDQLKEAQALGGSVTAAPVRPETPADDNPRTVAPRVADNVDKGKVDLNLQLANASLKQQKYQEAINTINSVANSLTEPEQQAQALFCLAEAKSALAGSDQAKLKEAALTYMRVVAHFRNNADAPVAESLLRSGAVLERAKLLPDALAAYQAVQSDYKDTPHAKDAAEGIARVQKAIEADKG